MFGVRCGFDGWCGGVRAYVLPFDSVVMVWVCTLQVCGLLGLLCFGIACPERVVGLDFV